ncbi:serine/threonine protein kinase [Virgibacillus sp. SK37]|uniref:serine/threonine protein kinase n=1 Tax=Virgibacillus sp. SK37 TaxID=403957 RepID=UPI0004D0BC0D|nr:serine/threonine protein kinase [Virgibacillus sp. SK37]AIF43033.1 serine/threonine-protein kinase [Virgibacillus sp. SK37]
MIQFHKLVDTILFEKEIKLTKEIKVEAYDEASLKHIASGRSAAVFLIKGTNLALKVFHPYFASIAKIETDIYRQLKGVPSYPNLYEAGQNYLVIDYIDGTTLFDCLIEGISIKEETIYQVENALQSAKERGLNPSDIHLKNIILTPEGSIKLIDVARFQQEKECHQWRDLAFAFHHFYKQDLFPKKLSGKVLNLISYMYKRNLLQSLTKDRKNNPVA